jgi:predicted O-linked N-acetylglucosamine transferase (SPINDLY family)
LHNKIDLLLDTVPYTGGTTTNHGLWMGVPTLTLAGATLPGRQGAALMNHVGLPEFVADSEDDFVAKAVAWSQNLSDLMVIRAGLRVRIANTELRSPQRVTRGIEAALRGMWRRWCRGEEPESFEVA